ncbi:ABC transporter permease [Marixanthomonas ophiurae]|uniref:ABC transporter permease n=1 Tax=Marixanthomonas ophiurae TaxID=387659 RepID=A0A3E1QDR0_9FLAO|nr:ABC transporter permease [Marixanthomonas ophiurae]RFN60290.1 ABC transporter permease [Marixanthomonas ophiurae]
MFKNYFKIAWRNSIKSKSTFLINVFGLAIGITTCLLIALFVFHELSYDTFNKKADRIVRVVLNAKVNGEQIKEALVMAPVAKALKNELPEVNDATRLSTLLNPHIIYKNTAYRDSKIAYVDPNFFDVFTLSIVEGNAKTPLDQPNSVILTTKEVKKYFGNENAIGKVLRVENYDREFTVTAIMEGVPKNSHFHFDMFVSTVGYAPAENTSWMESEFFTYLLLQKGTNIEALEAKTPPMVEKYMGPQMQERMGMTFSEFSKNNTIGLLLQPLTDIHLKSDFSGASQLEQGGDITYIYIFSAIALFMLLIACINFMNLSTASASKRAKEIGIRKVLGSNKKQLRHQFLMESFITTLLATILAIATFVLVLPSFNTLSGIELDINHLFTPAVGISLFATVIVISFLAGGYPAFFLSSFKPIAALKSKFSGAGNSKGVRSGLVVFQFVISAGLILATLVVYQQMEFIQNKKLGYDKDQLLVLRESYLLGQNEAAFKNELLNDPRVAQVSQSAFVPAGDTDTNMSPIFVKDKLIRRMSVYNVDDQYIPTMKMELVSGRNFSREFGVDSTKVIINQQAAKILGFGDEVLGKEIRKGSDNGGEILTIVGVVKDFNFRSLHQKIEPLIMLNKPYGGLIVRTKTGDMSALIEKANSLWLGFNSTETFNYTILDDSYNQTYLKEHKMGTILMLFAILTIFVACLGLFGLVTYTAEQRFKEIGIRKVLGSSVVQIVGLLTKDFLKLIMISFLIAFPLGIYLMNKWLQDFAYRIEIKWWIVGLAALITTAVAFITIGIKSVKAASANPVKSLRTE